METLKPKCEDLTFLSRKKMKWYIVHVFVGSCVKSGAKDDWDFRISDLVKNPDRTDI